MTGARPRKPNVQPASRKQVAVFPLKKPLAPLLFHTERHSSTTVRPLRCCEIMTSSAGVTTAHDSAPLLAEIARVSALLILPSAVLLNIEAWSEHRNPLVVY